MGQVTTISSVTHVDGEVFAQIEAGFDVKGAVEFDLFGAAGPGVQEFVVDFGLPGKNGEFGDGAGLLEVNAIANGHAGLQLREFDEGVARFAAEAFEFGGGGLGVACGQVSMRQKTNAPMSAMSKKMRVNASAQEKRAVQAARLLRSSDWVETSNAHRRRVHHCKIER